MHLSLTLLATSAALAGAQFIFNSSTHMFICPSTPANGTYCTGPSLSSNIIIRCTGTVGVAGNCNDNLDGVPPVGVKGFAPCYESSATAGDAACSYRGIVYPETGPSFPVPGSGSSGYNTTSAATAPSTTTAAASNVSLPVSASNATVPSSPTAVIGYNGTAAATGTGVAPPKSGFSDLTFTGAADRMIDAPMGALFVTFVATTAAFGLTLLF